MSKILYIANARSFYSSNPIRKIEKVVDCFRELGHEVHFVCGGDILGEAPPSNGGISKSIKQNSSTATSFLKNSVSEYRDLSHDKKLLAMLEEKYANEDFDLVWERSSRLHVAGLRFAKRRNLPYVMEWKDNLIRYKYSIFRGIALSQESEKINSASALVVESHMLARQIAEEEGLSIDKFKVAINAVDAEQFYCPEQRAPMRRSLNLAEDDFVIGYVGSYAFYHNVEILCDVMKYLIDNGCQKNIRFVLVGDGNGRKEFEKRADLLGVGEYFKVIGSVDKDSVPAYLSSFDCAILPDSTDIICPIKVQEYMAASLPVLVPDYEANAEVVTQDVEGLLFEPKNPTAIANAIIEMLNNPDRVVKKGKAARSSVISKLSWAATWGAVLEEVLEESSSR